MLVAVSVLMQDGRNSVFGCLHARLYHNKHLLSVTFQNLKPGSARLALKLHVFH